MSIFIPTLLTALNILVIQQGKLKQSLKLTLEERESLQEAMGGPDPARANELKSIFNSASVTKFKNIIPQLWPSVDLGQSSVVVSLAITSLGCSTSWENPFLCSPSMSALKVCLV